MEEVRDSETSLASNYSDNGQCRTVSSIDFTIQYFSDFMILFEAFQRISQAIQNQGLLFFIIKDN